MEASAKPMGRIARVRKNLRLGIITCMGSIATIVDPLYIAGSVQCHHAAAIAVYLGAVLVNKIADARVHSLQFESLIPIIIGLWITTAVQRAVGAYLGYGRNLYVRRVELEAERRLLAKASKVDLGHFDNSDWFDRLARAKRDVSWRPGDLTWSVLGLSGNIVTIILMAGLLASLHYVLVILALACSLPVTRD